MKTTLYWDDIALFSHLIYYNNGYKWRVFNGTEWTDSLSDFWESKHFDKSLTVNNFKEK